MTETKPQRVVVFGVAGHLGRGIIGRLPELPGGDFELLGVGSEHSEAEDFEYRGETLDVLTSSPKLRDSDLVFVCTPGPVALELVREALHAQAFCIDCSGVMAGQSEVAMPVRSRELAGLRESGAATPLVAVPSATTLAWTPLLDALNEGPGVSRVVGTLLQSASALGRRGLIALSEETIALFNQSETPEDGPAGQGVAFDVIPNRAEESRCGAEIARVFGTEMRIDLMSVQVPTFVGEGASLAIELSAPVEASELEKCLAEVSGLEIVAQGIGSRGLAAVEPGQREPSGPTLRDSVSTEGVLVGGVRPDSSLAPGVGWRLWLAYDPLRITSHHAIALAGLRFSAS